VEQFLKSWSQLKGKIDDQRFEAVKARLMYQFGHSIVWRDAIVQFFYKKSGINDTKGRIGHNRGRIEAESMVIKGYEIESITPFETASGGEAIACKIGQNCSAETVFSGDSGVYDIYTQYYDQNNGISSFKLFVNSKLISEWKADDKLPSDKPNGHTSTRHYELGVNLKNGDNIRIEGMPDRGEHAVIDYIEITVHSLN
jgi:alpha-glucuronidase